MTPVSSTARFAEREIDQAYLASPLLRLRFDDAIKAIMHFCEFESTKEQYSDHNTKVDVAIFCDEFANNLQYAIRWLYLGNLQGTGHRDPDYAKHIWDAQGLYQLSGDYLAFVAAYTHASRGHISLDLCGTDLICNYDGIGEAAYEAYDRLADPRIQASSRVQHSLQLPSSPPYRVKSGRIRYSRDPALVRDHMAVLERFEENAYGLPSSWRTSLYSYGDFRSVWSALVAISVIQLRVRGDAMRNGYWNLAPTLTYMQCPGKALVAQLSRYSVLPMTTVQSILCDLTYGARGVVRPDLALQPLVRLSNGDLAWMPSLIQCLSPERNLTALMNRIPAERYQYSALVDQKEDLLRQEILESLAGTRLRVRGPVSMPGVLPDIDLALVDDSERQCLVVELKWFIYPADTREVIEKSAEAARGIQQCKALSRAERSGAAVSHALGVEGFEISFAVASQNCIGLGRDQDPDFPVIRADHLCRQVRALDSLADTIRWLNAREYLPREGEDYSVEPTLHTIAGYTLHWYGIGLRAQP